METAPCDMCGMTVKLLACSRCKFAHYCSPDCQKAAWPTHKKVCKKLATASSEGADDARWEGNVPVKIFALPTWPQPRGSAGWPLPPLSPPRWKSFPFDEEGDPSTQDLNNALRAVTTMVERAASNGALGEAAEATQSANADFGFRDSTLKMVLYLLSSYFRLISYKVFPAEQTAARSEHDDDMLLFFLNAVRRLPNGAPVLELAYTDSKAVMVTDDACRASAGRCAQEVWNASVPKADLERQAATLAATRAGCPHASDIPAGNTGIVLMEVHAEEMALMRSALVRNSARTVPPPWLSESFPLAGATPPERGGFRASFLLMHSPNDPRFHTAPYAAPPPAAADAVDLDAFRAAMQAKEDATAAAFIKSPLGVRGRAKLLRAGLTCIAPFSVDTPKASGGSPRPVDLSKPTRAAARALLGMARMEQALIYEWATGLAREDTYVALIDAYRLRVEDTEKFQGARIGLAAGEDPFAGFAAFLTAARSRRGLLPADWTDADDRAALALGRSHVWANLRRRAGKPEMAGVYGMASLRHVLLRSIAAVALGSQVHTGAPVEYGADGRAVMGPDVGADDRYFC